MSAIDAVRHFHEALSAEDRVMARDLTSLLMEDLQAARSEDARERIFAAYLRDVQKLLRERKHASYRKD